MRRRERFLFCSTAALRLLVSDCSCVALPVSALAFPIVATTLVGSFAAEMATLVALSASAFRLYCLLELSVLLGLPSCCSARQFRKRYWLRCRWSIGLRIHRWLRPYQVRCSIPLLFGGPGLRLLWVLAQQSWSRKRCRTWLRWVFRFRIGGRT